MKYTKVVVVCNVCWRATGGDIETPADHTIIFKTSEETDDFFRIDICNDHATNGTTWPELLEVAEAVNPETPLTHRAVGRPRGNSEQVICPVCGKDYANKSGVALHMKSKHPAEWEGILQYREAEQKRKANERRKVEARTKGE